jgi:hypothetical protein
MVRELTRRAALGLGAVGVSASIGGCSTAVPLSSPSVGSAPEKSTSDGRTEFTFTNDGENQLAIHLLHNLQNRGGVFESPLDVQVFHNHDKLNIDSIELGFKPSFSPRPDILWKSPSFDWIETEFAEAERGWTKFSASDLGNIGQNTFELNFYLRYNEGEEPEIPVEIGFRAEVKLAHDGWLGGSKTLEIFDSFEIAEAR